MDHILDENNRQILRHLQNDASLSVEQLAEQVNLSRNACWRRVKNLEKNGTIKKRVAIVDAASVGLGLQVIVSIKTNDHSAIWLNKFRDAMRTMPEIVSAQRMTGELDYILKVRVADVAAYDLFYKRLIDKVNIADVSANIVMEDIKETTNLPI